MKYQEWDPAKVALANLIHHEVASWLGAEEWPLTEIINLLSRPPENIPGDFAFPCFRFAKALRKAPPQIASELATKLNAAASPWVEKVESLAAFCNFTINLNYFADAYLPAIAGGTYFAEPREHLQDSHQRIMVEYSQPNTHKEFHVGHARNFCLGDSLVRLLRYLGHEVFAVNYPGDEGTHIAKCLWYIRSQQQTPPATGRGAWLGVMYVAASQHLDNLEGEALKTAETEISEILAAIESKKGELYELWRETREWSLELFRDVYQKMDVHFDHYFYESEVSEESQALVDEFLKKGVFVEDDGAVGADLKDDKLGFMLVRKRDGNTLYATKDLALAKRKFQEFKIDKSIYVVASEQNLHFRQVFKTLEKMGFEAAKDCYHLSYGMVTLPEGKMSSRKGNTVSFQSLEDRLFAELQTVLDKYKGKWSDEEIIECRRRLAVGAIRYGMLATDPSKDVVFSISDWISFEGNSGPYLMYTYARTRSIIEKAQAAGITPSEGAFQSFHDEEIRELMRYMHDFNRIVVQSAEQYKPSVLCHFLFDSCRAFNRFYANHSVLKAENDATKSERLMLVKTYAMILKQGLNLLGITPPERM